MEEERNKNRDFEIVSNQMNSKRVGNIFDGAKILLPLSIIILQFALAANFDKDTRAFSYILISFVFLTLNMIEIVFAMLFGCFKYENKYFLIGSIVNWITVGINVGWEFCGLLIKIHGMEYMWILKSLLMLLAIGWLTSVYFYRKGYQAFINSNDMKYMGDPFRITFYVSGVVCGLSVFYIFAQDIIALSVGILIIIGTHYVGTTKTLKYFTSDLQELVKPIDCLPIGKSDVSIGIAVCGVTYIILWLPYLL